MKDESTKEVKQLKNRWKRPKLWKSEKWNNWKIGENRWEIGEKGERSKEVKQLKNRWKEIKTVNKVKNELIERKVKKWWKIWEKSETSKKLKKLKIGEKEIKRWKVKKWDNWKIGEKDGK